MTVAELKAELDRRGVKLKVEGGRLRYQPVSAVPPDLKEQLRTHKAEVMATLEDNRASYSLEAGSKLLDVALKRLEADPNVPPQILEATRRMKAQWGSE